MNKFLVCFFVFALSSSILAGEQPDEKLHERCLYPTVKLEINPQSCGSGFIVRSVKKSDGGFTNVVLTAAHILNAPVTVCVPKFKDWSTVTGYDKFPCVVHSKSDQYDLAVIFFESPTVMPVAELDFDSKSFIGSEVFKLGYGVSDECRLDRGEVTSVATKAPFVNHLRINAHTIFGDSGGPCFLKSNYKVIGVTKAIRGFQHQFLTSFVYVTPISLVKTWNTESQNSLEFVFDTTKPLPFTVAELQKRNQLLNLKVQLEAVKKEIETKASELAAKKALEESLDKEIKRIEEGKELPTPPMPNVQIPNDDAVAPPPPSP